jgi:hypothetical protein
MDRLPSSVLYLFSERYPFSHIARDMMTCLDTRHFFGDFRLKFNKTNAILVEVELHTRPAPAASVRQSIYRLLTEKQSLVACLTDWRYCLLAVHHVGLCDMFLLPIIGNVRHPPPPPPEERPNYVLRGVSLLPDKLFPLL